MSYELNSLGLRPHEMASYKMHRPSLYGGSTAPTRRQPKSYKTGIKALSLNDLRQLCFAKDPEALAEYNRRFDLGEV